MHGDHLVTQSRPTSPTDPDVEMLADRLRAAGTSGLAVAPLTDEFPELTVEQAYRVQQAQIRQRVDGGCRILGHKIGLTSTVMQRQLGVDEPDYGHLTSDMFHLEAQPISIARYISPRIEPEIAVVLREHLTGPGVTTAQAINAVDYLLPSLEIIDSRIRDWRITLVDTVADNASSGGVVLGSTPTRLSDLTAAGVSVRTLGCVLTRRGEVVGTGASGAAIGSPITALVWLANALGQHGSALAAGSVIMTGSVTAAVPVAAGDTVTATFSRLGSVTARFVD